MRFVRILTFLLTFAAFTCVLPAQTAPAPAKKAAKADTSKSALRPAAAPAPAGLIDINHATAAELKTLTGIGDAYSAAIVKNRPYKNKTQLRSRNVIPPATYEKIKDQIVAKQ